MLQFFREKLQGIVVWGVIGLIILVFVLGAGSYLFKNTYDDSLAKVDGESINLSIVNERYQEEIKQHYAKKTYAKVDLNPNILKKQIFYGMLNHLAIIKGLEKNNFAVTTEQLLDAVKSNPNWHIDGKFSKTKYLNWLNTLGISEIAYQDFMRQNLLMRQLRNIILMANFLPMTEVDDFIAKWFQQRKCSYTIVPKQRFGQKIPTEQELQEYYVQHKDDFFSPPTVKIEYLEVASKDLLDKVNPTSEQLLQYYNSNLGYYTLPELVSVRHILITDKVDKEKDSAKNKLIEQSAETKIAKILAQLQAGENFQELAKKWSQDQSSASAGGDLGWIGRGEIDDVEFDRAAFALVKPGSYSDVVKSKFGYHIIQLVEKRLSKVNKFKEVSDKVAQHYKEEQIQPKLQEIYEKFAQAAEKNTELTKLANELGLTVKQSNDFTSKGDSSGISSYPELISAAFAKAEMHTNSEVIRIADDHLVLFRVVDKKPGRAKFFIEAEASIKQILIDQAATVEAQKYAQNLAIKLANSKNPAGVAKLHNLPWKVVDFKRDNNTVPLAVRQYGFMLSEANSQKVFKTNEGDFLILQLNSIKEQDINQLLSQDPEIKKKLQADLIQYISYIEERLYHQDLYNNANIKFSKNAKQFD